MCAPWLERTQLELLPEQQFLSLKDVNRAGQDPHALMLAHLEHELKWRWASPIWAAASCGFWPHDCATSVPNGAAGG